MLTETLKIFRLKLKLTQKNVATVLEIATNSYTKKENGINPFTVDELKKLKNLFNISDSDFVKIFFD